MMAVRQSREGSKVRLLTQSSGQVSPGESFGTNIQPAQSELVGVGNMLLVAEEHTLHFYGTGATRMVWCWQVSP